MKSKEAKLMKDLPKVRLEMAKELKEKSAKKIVKSVRKYKVDNLRKLMGKLDLNVDLKVSRAR